MVVQATGKGLGASEWVRTTLADVIDLISGGTPNTSIPAYWNGEIPWLSVVDFNTGYRWVSRTEKHITKRGLSESATTLLCERDVIISARGTVGALAQLSVPMAFNQSCYGIRGKHSISDTDFIYYFLHQAVGEMKQVAHGGVFDTITRGTFKLIQISLPPLPEQRAIAHILGTLDDKIELNRKQNETLEAMARALFKAWFVDFEPVRAKLEGRWQRGQSLPGLPAHLYDLFPDCLVESELGEIPKGWEIGSFSNAVEIIGGGTPKTTVSEYWDGEIPWFSVVDTPLASDVFVVQTEKSITHAGLNGSSARLITKGTTIISARGTVGNLAIAGCDMAFNQSCYALRGKNDSGSYFVFLYAQRMIEHLKAMAHGSVFSTITRQTFEAVRAVLPPGNMLQQFEKNAASLLEPILGNVNSAHSLAQLRDTLLPKLISGELRISDAERFLSELEKP